MADDTSDDLDPRQLKAREEFARMRRMLEANVPPAAEEAPSGPAPEPEPDLEVEAQDEDGEVDTFREAFLKEFQDSSPRDAEADDTTVDVSDEPPIDTPISDTPPPRELPRESARAIRAEAGDVEPPAGEALTNASPADGRKAEDAPSSAEEQIEASEAPSDEADAVEALEEDGFKVEDVTNVDDAPDDTEAEAFQSERAAIPPAAIEARDAAADAGFPSDAPDEPRSGPARLLVPVALFASGLGLASWLAMTILGALSEPATVVERPTATIADPGARALEQVNAIREAQRLLNELGYATGVADGAADPATIEAARTFANDFGIAYTGIDTTFVNALRSALGMPPLPVEAVEAVDAGPVENGAPPPIANAAAGAILPSGPNQTIDAPLDPVLDEINRIREAQNLMNAMGYDAGVADGDAGPDSVRAAEQFSSAFSVDFVGFDEAFLVILRGAADAGHRVGDPPPDAGAPAPADPDPVLTEVNRVREGQELLNDLGYDLGRPDGDPGPATIAAAQSFAADKNLVFVEFDQAFLTELRRARTASELAAQAAAAVAAEPPLVRIERIRESQTLLNALGYDVGAADGDAGPSSVAAAEAFAAAQGFAFYGFDDNFLIALQDADAARQAALSIELPAAETPAIDERPLSTAIDPIIEGQTLLNDLGYAAGVADGAAGPATLAAAAAFADAYGITFDRFDAEFLTALRDASSARAAAPIAASPDLTADLLAEPGSDADINAAAVELPISEEDRIREGQTLLNTLGYDVGAPDGQEGPATRAAAQGFAETQGLTSGEFDSTLLIALRSAKIAQDQTGLSDEQLRSIRIRDSQILLTEMGYDPGAIDGERGTKSLQAASIFTDGLDYVFTGFDSLFVKRLRDAQAAGGQPPAIDADGVIAIQAGLNTLGYNAGTADGIIGERTRSAATAFAAANGVSSSILSPTLLDAVNTALDERGAGAGTPPARYSPGERFRDCPTCPEMIALRPGAFTMGSGDEDPARTPSEEPTRTVVVSPGFAIGRFEVTWAEWQACVNDEACSADGPEAAGGDETWGRGARPVINVSPADITAFIGWLNSKAGGQVYRLPSEAEWEYAARASGTSIYPWGDEADRSRANFGRERCCTGRAEGADTWVTTSPVGSFPPNRLGLHDMIGNVAELVSDCWHASYAGAEGTAAPRTAGCEGGGSMRRFSEPEGRVSYLARGGSWRSPPEDIRAASRLRIDEGARHSYVGFRVARINN